MQGRPGKLPVMSSKRPDEAYINPSPPASHRLSAGVLSVLGGAFLFRVLAQLMQALASTKSLPAFDAWQGSGLPYPALFAVQIAILFAMGWAIRLRGSGTAILPPGMAIAALWLGAAYFLVMLLRLVAGATVFSEFHWFSSRLPALFHLVLACFIMELARIDLAQGALAGILVSAGRVLRYMAFPAVISLSLLLHLVMAGAGIPLALSAMLAIGAGAGAVIVHEINWPYRVEWSPSATDVRTDLLYLGLVQILLPRLLAVAAVWGASQAFADFRVQQPSWPHQWPPIAQAAFMLLAADFMRYWLHRAAHSWPLLWRLHAVHHSPRRLYSVSVSRFHPFEKILQYGFDALPFLLLGAAEEAMALYFVFYAVNGFYQHSNCDVRLGRLNYIISGPELHRWHHSASIAESNHNYGNNLIVWDLLFGTFFWPKGKAVGQLGLINRDYPRGFLGQLRGPFVAGLDKAARP